MHKIIIYISVVTVIYYNHFFEATSCKVVYLYLIILDKYLIHSLPGKHGNNGDFNQSTGCGGPAAGIHNHDAGRKDQRKCQNWHICIARSVLYPANKRRQNYFQSAESNFKFNLT